MHNKVMNTLSMIVGPSAILLQPLGFIIAKIRFLLNQLLCTICIQTQPCLCQQAANNTMSSGGGNIIQLEDGWNNVIKKGVCKLLLVCAAEFIAYLFY